LFRALTHASGASRPPKLEELAGESSAKAIPGEEVTAAERVEVLLATKVPLASLQAFQQNPSV